MISGIEKLTDSVKRDCNNGEGCFNPNGCDHEFYRTVQQDNQALIDMGITTATKCVSKCFHKYCDKFAWVIERAKHYEAITGVSHEQFIDSWEQDRSYWYMNYYQDSNQPKLDNADCKVWVFETVDDAVSSMNKQGFRCPACNGISKDAYTCDSGLEISKGKVCDWKSYGLFGTMGKGAYVLVKDKMKINNIFMPIAWEPQP